VDAIAFEVIRNALVAATDEMVLALKRSAYSTNIKTRSDFSCAFFDARLRCVAQGFAQPVHLASMVEQVPRAIRRYGAENLGPGDVVVMFTDGVSEAESPSGEQFGQLRVEECVERLAARTSQEIVEGLVQAVVDWTGERGPNDDLTLVVLKTL